MALSQIGLVFPGKQDIADAALRKSESRCPRAGIEHRNMPVERLHEFLGLAFLAAVDMARVSPGAEISQPRAAGHFRVGRDDLRAGFDQIAPILDQFRIALAHQEDNRRAVGSAVIRQTFFPIGGQKLRLAGDGIDVGRNRKGHDVGAQPVHDGARLCA